jgi:DNA-binding NtrC family response regulator
MVIRRPAARERGDYIPLLARYCLEAFGEKYERPIMPWGSDFVAALLAHFVARQCT